MLVADEVQDREARLGRGVAQTSAELLQEHGHALGRPEEQHRVDLGDVEPLVEDVDGEQRPQLPHRQAAAGVEPLGVRGVGVNHRLRAGPPR